MGIMVLFKVYGIALNMVKKIDKNLRRSLFTAICSLLERLTAHGEMISVTQCFKQRFTTLELITRATGGGYKVMKVVW